MHLLKGSRWLVVSASLLIALSLALALGGAVAADPPCAVAEGTVGRASYRSDLIRTAMVYSVYLPPCYDPARPQPYPVLYLLHGSNDDDNHWLRLGLAQALDAGIGAGDYPPMVVVLPFGDWIANENRFGRDSWSAVLTEELVPLTQARYHIDPARRAIGGISRGGFWAVSVGLRQPQDFRAVGGHSAFFAVGNAPADHNPLDLARSVPPSVVPPLYLDRGLDDYAAEGLDLMNARLQQAGIAHVYSLAPGEHDNRYWSARLPDYLAFYARALSEPVAVTPSPFATVTPSPPPPAGLSLYLPAVAFPSPRFSLEPEQFARAIAGEHDPKLIILRAHADELARRGVALSPQTTVLDEFNAVYGTLWRDRTRWTLVPFDALTPRLRALWIGEAHPLDTADYPLAFPDSATPNFYPDRLTRIFVTGVTALARRTTDALDENGVAWAAEAIAPYLAQADYVHTSNEVSIYPTCPHTDSETLGGLNSFCSKPEHFDLLVHLGVNIVELSGNHNNDYGYQAYLDTLEWYRARGIRTVGGGETLSIARDPLILSHNGNRIAWVACNWVGPYYALVEENPSATGGARPGAAFCDLNWLREALPQLKVAHDVVIVTVQYWEFDQHPPTDQQRVDFATLASLGADVVIGTHAHVPQTYAFVPGMGGRESFVHYGIGNFIFDQPFWATRRFTLDRLWVYEGRLHTVDILPGIIDDLARPRLMTRDEWVNYLFVLFVQHGGF